MAILAVNPPISFCVMADAQKSKNVQLGARVAPTTKVRLEKFAAAHPMQPNIGTLVDMAINQYLDREEPNLPSAAKRSR